MYSTLYTNRASLLSILLKAYVCFVLLATTISAAETPVDFENDIVAIFTKSGCNAGACHGAAIGRGGFKLSLYGGNSAADYDSLVHHLQGRRINLANPAESLLVLKPTEHISHEGGTLFDMDSEEARLLKSWISQGAKQTSFRDLVAINLKPDKIYTEDTSSSHLVQVTASYKDGSTRDVTKWAVLQPEDTSAVQTNTKSASLTIQRRGRHIVSVRYLTKVKPLEILVPLNTSTRSIPAPPVNNFIDTEINKALATLRIMPSPQCDDGQFIRRIYLDLTGRLPTSQQTRNFIASSERDKRSNLIDSLLASQGFNTYWTYYFSELLRISPQRLGGEGANAYFSWLSSRISENINYKTLVTELLLADGDAFEIGPANYYRTMPDARQQAEFTSELLMGTRLRCANCHNHPLDHWTQDDYHGLAAIFAKLNISQTVTVNPAGTTIHPLTLEPAVAKIPAGLAIKSTTRDPRREFTTWLTHENNQYFAQAITNRLWKQMMGRGLVEPVDDFRSTNPATHPFLIKALADEFVSSNYDIKHILSVIANSAAYQRSAHANQSNQYDSQFYSHAFRVPLHPAVHADAVSDVLGIPEQYGEEPFGTRALELRNPTLTSRTLDILGRCGRDESCETATNGPSRLTRTLHFFNGEFLNGRIDRNKGRLAELLNSETSPMDIITEYYLTAFSRYPTKQETAFWNVQLKQHITEDSLQPFLEDFVWGLLSSRDFTTNH